MCQTEHVRLMLPKLSKIFLQKKLLMSRVSLSGYMKIYKGTNIALFLVIKVGISTKLKMIKQKSPISILTTD